MAAAGAAVLVTPLRAPEAGRPAADARLQVFRAALTSHVWRVDASGAAVLERSSAAFEPLARGRLATCATTTPDARTFAVFTDDCRLTACGLTAGTDNTSADPAGLQPVVGSEGGLAAPCLASDLAANSDGSLLILLLDRSMDATQPAALVVSITRTPLFGEAVPWRVELRLLRELSDAYAGGVLGGLRFSASVPAMLHLATARHHELRVGLVRLARSEVVQQVDAAREERRKVSLARWSRDGRQVVVVCDDCHLVLWRQAKRGEAWAEVSVEASVDDVLWHPSGMLIALVCSAAREVLLLDCALQLVAKAAMQWPGDGEVDDDDEQAEGRSWPPLLLHGQRRSAWLEFGGQGAPLAVATFARNGACVVSCFVGVSASWRWLIARHLQARNDEAVSLPSSALPPPHARYSDAVVFGLALAPWPELFLPACRLLLRELGVFRGSMVPQVSRDYAAHWQRSLLTRFRQTILPLEEARRARWAPQLEAAERKFVADCLRLGLVEQAAQFAFRLAQDAPHRPFVARLFDRVVVWAAAHGQADTVAPLVRSAAQRMRAFIAHKSSAAAATSASGSSSSDNINDDDDDEDDKDDREGGGYGTELVPFKEPPGDSESRSPSGSSGSSRSSTRSRRSSSSSPSTASSEGSLSSSSGATSEEGSDGKVFLDAVPAWRGGRGGCVDPEELGRVLESLEDGRARELAKDVERLWREWRKREAQESLGDTASPSSLSLRPSGGLGKQQAARLGLWLECRGKLVQAEELYQSHGLHGARERLRAMREPQKLLPCVTLTHPES